MCYHSVKSYHLWKRRVWERTQNCRYVPVNFSNSFRAAILWKTCKRLSLVFKTCWYNLLSVSWMTGMNTIDGNNLLQKCGILLLIPWKPLKLIQTRSCHIKLYHLLLLCSPFLTNRCLILISMKSLIWMLNSFMSQRFRPI